MTTSKCEHDEKVTAVRNPVRILRDSRRISVASSAANDVEDFPNTRPSLEAALQKVALPIPRSEGENTFDTIDDSYMSDERPTSRIRPIQSISLASLEDTVC